MNSRIILFILLSILLSGCEGEKVYSWQVAPVTHVCTEQQMSKAERESSYCEEHTSYYGSYCYGAAILRNCTRALDK